MPGGKRSRRDLRIPGNSGGIPSKKSLSSHLSSASATAQITKRQEASGSRATKAWSPPSVGCVTLPLLFCTAARESRNTFILGYGTNQRSSVTSAKNRNPSVRALRTQFSTRVRSDAAKLISRALTHLSAPASLLGFGRFIEPRPFSPNNSPMNVFSLRVLAYSYDGSVGIGSTLPLDLPVGLDELSYKSSLSAGILFFFCGLMAVPSSW